LFSLRLFLHSLLWRSLIVRFRNVNLNVRDLVKHPKVSLENRSASEQIRWANPDDILKRVRSKNQKCDGRKESIQKSFFRRERPNSIFVCTSIFPSEQSLEYGRKISILEVDYRSYSFGKGRLNSELPKSFTGSQFPDF
jgi:hypothetical protein